MEKDNASSLENCEIGSHVFIGGGATFMCANAPIKIANHVMFEPNVTMITGNHRIDRVGKYMIDVTVNEKRKEDDVWVGANVTILKGVKIGEGSVVAAGTVVTKMFLHIPLLLGCPQESFHRVLLLNRFKQHKKLLKKGSMENVGI